MGALTTLAEYKAYASITSTDATRDAALQTMLDAATSALRRFCGRDGTNGFESATRTEVKDGTDCEALLLNEYPVTSITSITQVLNDGSTSVVDSTTYRLEANTGIVERQCAVSGRFALTRSYLYGSATSRASLIDKWGVSSAWVQGFQNFSVIYVGGYSTTPSDLKYVVWRWTDQLRGKAATSIFRSESIGDYAYTLKDDTDWRTELTKLIAPFVRGSM